MPFNYLLLPPVPSLCSPCSRCGGGGWRWGHLRSTSTVSLHHSLVSRGLQQAEKRVNHYFPSTSSHPWTLSPRLRGGGGSWPDGDRLCPTSLCRPSRGRSLFGGLSTPFGYSFSPLLPPSASSQALPTSHLYSVFGKLAAGSRTTNPLCLEPDRTGFSSPISAKGFGGVAQRGPRLRSQLTRLLGMWVRNLTDLAVTVGAGWGWGVQEVGMEEWQERRRETWLGVV